MKQQHSQIFQGREMGKNDIFYSLIIVYLRLLLNKQSAEPELN